MRLVRIIQLAVGMVATSGATILFAGTTYAASAATLKPTSDNSQQSIQGKASTTVKKVVETDKSMNSDSSLPINQAELPNVVPAVTENSDQQPGDVTNSVTTVTKNLDNKSKVVGAVADDSNSTVSKAPVAVTNDGIAASQTSEQPVVPAALDPSTPPDTNSQLISSDTPAIIYNSAVLNVQPAITTAPPAIMSTDRAVNLPMPIAPFTPLPAKPDVMLVHFANELASMILPHVDTHSVHYLSQPAVSLILFTILLSLLIRATSTSYGSWLRRTGFVAAARGDIPQTFHSFALSLMSYVQSFQKLHSSFLVLIQQNMSLDLALNKKGIAS